MSCPPFDLKEYFLKELPLPQAAAVEGHINTCSGCREELERLQLTEAALFSLRDEEIPQRIAFVSDKIFEPSPVRRWFSAFWGSAGRLGFASAAMLSAAIVFSSLHTKSAPAPVPGPTVIETRMAAGPTPEEIQARIDSAVAKAVDKAVTQSKDTMQLVAALRRENEQASAMLVRAAGEIEMYKRRDRNSQVANYTEPVLGDGK